MNQSRTSFHAPLAAGPSSPRPTALSLGGTAAPLRRLVPGRCGLRLRVLSGTIWLTRDSSAGAAGRSLGTAGRATELATDVAPDLAARDGRDVWVMAGDSVDLPAGSSWLVQGWPQAGITFEAIEPVSGHGMVAQAAAGWRRLGGALLRRARRSAGHGLAHGTAAGTPCAPPA